MITGRCYTLRNISAVKKLTGICQAALPFGVLFVVILVLFCPKRFTLPPCMLLSKVKG